VLTYAFCNAYTSPSNNSNSPPPSSLSLDPLPYAAPFSGVSPLGPNVSINSETGIISGIAPPTGQYVVNVCITEWRNGKAFSQHRKDFILKVQDCDLIEANLPDKIIQCDSFTVRFENQSASSAITSYAWNFGEPSSANNTSTQPTPLHTYADTGLYKATLMVTGPNSCVGKDSTIVIVYPGFHPGFTVAGSCFQNPFIFTDTTTTKYGVVNQWNWNFGDPASITDNAKTKNATYKYTNAGNVTATLLVSTSKGCEATITKTVNVLDKPLIVLPFNDTLICSIDTLQLIAQSTGNYSWSPTVNLLNPNAATPLVFPKDTTVYTVTVTDNGCINTATVKVNVLDSIKVELGPDSTICTTDFATLSPVSYGLGYQWQSSTGEVVQPVKYPSVQPLVNTYYYVLANLGKCTARDTVLIKPIPYPFAFAGADTSICYATPAFLHGSIKASAFNWSPVATLTNANTLKPVAAPATNMLYILTVTDTLGCPKPVSDTVKVTVIPPVKVFAGNDTAVVKGQPLQLYVVSNFDNAATYLWTPSTGLSNSSIVNPVATLNINGDSIKYNIRVTTPEGCVGNDQIVVKVFKTAPDIFVPTGFTPNNDGRNDVLKPIAVGISKIDFFRVYNRWGQLLFETADFERGWDGKINGVPQDSGTYIFVAQGRDYTGKNIFRKGTTVLIR
jgi:gliding motility-associated-like protein